MLCMAGVAGLLGCATPLPTMPDGNYVLLADIWTGSHFCAQSGYLDARTASLGASQVQKALSTWVYEPARLTNMIERRRLSSERPTQEQCNALAMGIHARQTQIDDAAANAQYQREEMARLGQQLGNMFKTQQTNCTWIGNQAFCNSY